MKVRSTRTLLSAGAMAVVVLGAGVLVVHGDQAPAATTSGHKVLTNQEDRQRLMDMLKITMFPSGPGAYLASTYDEKTASPYPVLPDPLVMNNGTKVTTASQWARRRAEIVELFSREVYGRRPANIPKVTWEVVRTADGLPGGGTLFGPATAAPSSGTPVTTKYLVGRVDNSAYPLVGVNILATLSIPKSAKGPVPVVLAFGGGTFEGAPATPNPCAPPAPPAGPGRAQGPGVAGAGRGGAAPLPAVPPAPSAQEQIFARGWGYATVSTGSIQADNGQGLTCGIIGLVNKGQPRKLDDWGVLSAWGWGMSKVLDYLETDKAVDAKKVAVHGHSRTGKAALVAMAYDERFSNGFISSSGQSGAKLHRRKYGEAIENIAALNEYHWMAGNYLKYAGRWDTLPVDSHELIALVAPRPVFLSTGKGPDTNPDGTVKMMQPGDPSFVASRGPIEQQAANINDAWVDPKGTFQAGLFASPVYTLLGKKGMSAAEFPAIETGVMDGDVAFRQHSAGHTPGPNWPVFLEFAARYWK
jgi:hypothetical protein